ncbi:MAG TPA: hypothetical protein VN282_25180 [Pyrinomonadaceae bacterium]|nr:hypothetical protein [Pyrinomonadaceae bacterium]
MKSKVHALLLACALTAAAAYVAPAAPAPQLAPARASYAGTYHHKTYRPGGEGYDNTLEVEDRGRGRLHVRLSGIYIYKASGAETMHEGGGEGEATLRANIATASVTPDGGGSPCRVIIIFDDGEAGVRADSACGFNVRLDGTYRMKGAPPAGVGVGTGGPRQIRFDVLSDFVNNHESNKTGAHFVITSVPAEKVKLVKPAGAGHRGMFYLSFDETDGDASTSFITSAELVKNLRASPVKETAALRVTAVLVEFLGEFDVYRSSFVTKVEGYGDDGSLLWVATGPEPARVRMRQ